MWSRERWRQAYGELVGTKRLATCRHRSEPFRCVDCGCCWWCCPAGALRLEKELASVKALKGQGFLWTVGHPKISRDCAQ